MDSNDNKYIFDEYIQAIGFVDVNGNQAPVSTTNGSTVAQNIVTITSAAYTALTTKDANTLYFIL